MLRLNYGKNAVDEDSRHKSFGKSWRKTTTREQGNETKSGVGVGRKDWLRMAFSRCRGQRAKTELD